MRLLISCGFSQDFSQGHYFRIHPLLSLHHHLPLMGKVSESHYSHSLTYWIEQLKLLFIYSKYYTLFLAQGESKELITSWRHISCWGIVCFWYIHSSLSLQRLFFRNTFWKQMLYKTNLNISMLTGLNLVSLLLTTSLVKPSNSLQPCDLSEIFVHYVYITCIDVFTFWERIFLLVVVVLWWPQNYYVY